MTKRNITKSITSVGKVAAVIIAISQMETLETALGDYAAWAAIAFAAASATKDIVVTILDMLDDGVLNGSVGPLAWSGASVLAITAAVLLLPSCAGYDVTGGIRGYGGEVRVGEGGSITYWIDADEMARRFAPPAIVTPSK